MTCRVRGGHLPELGRQSPRRRILVEAAWAYRYPARVGEPLKALLETCPKPFATSPGKRKSGCVRAVAH
jgi:hypothetical protein